MNNGDPEGPRLDHAEANSDGLQPLLCFVAMPFGSNNEYSRGNLESNYIYEQIMLPSIQQAATRLGRSIDIVREVDRNVPGSITKSIVERLAAADICVVDITGRNPNVFLELGIRYAMRQRTTILLRQEHTQVPFDIGGFRCLTYDCFRPTQAVHALAETIVAGIGMPSDSTDSLVFETFPNMTVDVPDVIVSSRGFLRDGRLRWEDWWRQVTRLGRMLKEAYENGRFVPDVVLGISNGGLVVADLIGRETYQGVPIHALWADRWAKGRADKELPPSHYFENDLNIALIEALKRRYVDTGNSVHILLVDDLVYTSSTAVQADQFLKNHLGTEYKLLFTPLYCRDTLYLDGLASILPYGIDDGAIFNITMEDYYAQIRGDQRHFPYKKALT